MLAKKNPCCSQVAMTTHPSLEHNQTFLHLKKNIFFIYLYFLVGSFSASFFQFKAVCNHAFASHDRLIGKTSTHYILLYTLHTTFKCKKGHDCVSQGRKVKLDIACRFCSSAWLVTHNRAVGGKAYEKLQLTKYMITSTCFVLWFHLTFQPCSTFCSPILLV